MSYLRIVKNNSKKYNLQPQILKGGYEHALISLLIYKQNKSQWKPYLLDDVLGLAYVISKHSNCVQKGTGVSYKNPLTEATLARSCLRK